MNNFFLKDSVLKVISFVIAILIWFYIIAVIDPSVEVSVKDIPIRYTNQNVIEEKGFCLISDENAKVELKISGSRKRIADIDSKNIYATVDLANVTKTGTFSMPIAISIPYEYNEIVSKKPYNASVIIDRVVNAEREVKVLTAGNTANGYIAGVAVPSQKSVKLKGASTMIDRIASVGVQLRFDDRTADINDTEDLFFIDRVGKPIAKENEIYSLVKMDIEEIQVECPVYKLKSVPIKVNPVSVRGVENYKISVQPSNITIYAENDVLDTIEYIMTEVVALDKMEENSKTTGIVVPDGVMLRDGITEVTVKAEKRG